MVRGGKWSKPIRMRQREETTITKGYKLDSRGNHFSSGHEEVVGFRLTFSQRIKKAGKTY